MKKITTLVVASLCTVASFAQEIELSGKFTKGESPEPELSLADKKILSKKFDLTYYALGEANFIETLIGISYKPTQWLSVGFGAGIESNPAIYRLACRLYCEKEKNSALAVFEKGDGSDNYRYTVTLLHKFSEKFSLGVRAWRYHGVGPLAKYLLFPKLNTSILAMYARDFEFEVHRVTAGFAVEF